MIPVDKELYLLSTVVAPTFQEGRIELKPITREELIGCLRRVKPGHNLCGHPITSNLLKGLVPELPEPVRDFWKGDGMGIAVRPRNGVRSSASSGDTNLSDLSDLEWITVTFYIKNLGK